MNKRKQMKGKAGREEFEGKKGGKQLEMERKEGPMS
jgi:hypothetical protein